MTTENNSFFDTSEAIILHPWYFPGLPYFEAANRWRKIKGKAQADRV